MNNVVFIKGNRYGISIVLDDETDFDIILEELKCKLQDAEDFFDCDKQLAVTFENRNLTVEELDQILTVIKDNSKLNIQYVLEENSELEATFFDIIQTAKDSHNRDTQDLEDDFDLSNLSLTSVTPIPLEEPDEIIEEQNSVSLDSAYNGMFYRGTLRSGQSIETPDSLVVIGDVNPGATIISGGNVVIIGSLKGTVHAGTKDKRDSFVMALSMTPMQIQIADVLIKLSDAKHVIKHKKEPMIAMIHNNKICIEAVSKAAIQDLYI